ncbi:uncharacterized protein LOC107261935 [Ricinus communis]|uniref:uncharacterized protein LOC107261935 n=1 Tax=Ricinus communis TaxID=3988 RepID=UPI00201B2F61|nr:uncharacterized protein LOC107261935 [Ricinus communis]
MTVDWIVDLNMRIRNKSNSNKNTNQKKLAVTAHKFKCTRLSYPFVFSLKRKRNKSLLLRPHTCKISRSHSLSTLLSLSRILHCSYPEISMKREIKELRRQRDFAQSQVDELQKKLQEDQRLQAHWNQHHVHRSNLEL